MVVAHGRAENLVLPIGIVCSCALDGIAVGIALLPSQGVPGVAALAVETFYEGHILAGVHHVHGLCPGGEGEVAVVAHLHGSTRAALLGGDENHTIGTAATIDGTGTGILQHGERLDVGRIHQRQRIAHTLDVVVVEHHAIDDNQRLGAGIQGRTASNHNVCARTGLTTGHIDVHTGHLALNQFLRAGDDAMILLIGFEGGHSTRHVLLLHTTVANHYGLLQRLGVLHHGDVDCGGGHNLLGDIAHVGEYKHGSFGNREGEFPVQVREDAIVCAFLPDGNTGKLTHVVLYVALHRDVLGPRRDRH